MEHRRISASSIALIVIKDNNEQETAPRVQL